MAAALREREKFRKVLASLGDGAYSDLIIKCGKDEHHVHKVFVCTRCRFFEKACQAPWAEAKSGIIHLPEDDPDAVVVMLHFLYKGLSFPKVLGDSLTGRASIVGIVDPLAAYVDLRLNAKVYVVANKYDLGDLGAIVLKTFQNWIMYKLYHETAEFAEAVAIVYRAIIDENDPLKRWIIEAMSFADWHMTREPIVRLLEDVPGVALDLVAANMKKKGRRALN